MRLVLLFLLMVLGVPGPAMAVKLVFVGDIMVHQDQLDSARVGDTYDFNPQFQFIAPFLLGDMVIGNFETVLRGRPPYTGYPAFNTPDSLAETLEKAVLRRCFWPIIIFLIAAFKAPCVHGISCRRRGLR